MRQMNEELQQYGRNLEHTKLTIDPGVSNVSTRTVSVCELLDDFRKSQVELHNGLYDKTVSLSNGVAQIQGSVQVLEMEIKAEETEMNAFCETTGDTINRVVATAVASLRNKRISQLIPPRPSRRKAGTKPGYEGEEEMGSKVEQALKLRTLGCSFHPGSEEEARTEDPI